MYKIPSIVKTLWVNELIMVSLGSALLAKYHSWDFLFNWEDMNRSIFVSNHIVCLFLFAGDRFSNIPGWILTCWYSSGWPWSSFLVLLPPPPEYWDHRCVPLCALKAALGTQHRAPCMPGRHPTNWAALQAPRYLFFMVAKEIPSNGARVLLRTSVSC